MEISASRIASFGQGFYTATQTDPINGPAEICVAVRTLQPLIGSIEDISALVDSMAELARPRDPRITADLAAEIRHRLLELGYDGIVVQDGGGDGIDYVVAITDGSVKVVIDR